MTNLFHSLCNDVIQERIPAWEAWGQLSSKQQHVLLSLIQETNHIPIVMSYVSFFSNIMNWQEWDNEDYRLPEYITLPEIHALYAITKERKISQSGVFIDMVFSAAYEFGRMDLLNWILQKELSGVRCEWNDMRTTLLLNLLGQGLKHIEEREYGEILKTCVHEFLDTPSLLAQRDGERVLINVLTGHMEDAGDLPQVVHPLIDLIPVARRPPPLQAWVDKQALLEAVRDTPLALGKKM